MLMKNPILTLAELKQLGFQIIDEKQPLDNGDYYNWWVLYKNDNELHITYEYDSKDCFTKGYVELNGEVLKGRELQKSDVEFLIELM